MVCLSLLSSFVSRLSTPPPPRQHMWDSFIWRPRFEWKVYAWNYERRYAYNVERIAYLYLLCWFGLWCLCRRLCADSLARGLPFLPRWHRVLTKQNCATLVFSQGSWTYGCHCPSRAWRSVRCWNGQTLDGLVWCLSWRNWQPPYKARLLLIKANII